jgi:hypothetical protein
LKSRVFRALMNLKKHNGREIQTTIRMAGTDPADPVAGNVMRDSDLFYGLSSMECQWDEFPVEMCECLKEIVEKLIPAMQIKVKKPILNLFLLCLFLTLIYFFLVFIFFFHFHRN